MSNTRSAASIAAARRRIRAASRPRAAFTLLEVVLALAILVGALAVIGELADQGLGNARNAAALAEAQLLCEGKLAEITAGLVAASAVQGVPLEVDPAWIYSIAVEPTVDDGLVAVRVTVAENLPPERRPVEYSLVRWMLDPTRTTTPASTP